MEFNISLFELQMALKAISTVAKPSALDITGQVFIEARKDNSVVFLATNSQLFITKICYDHIEIRNYGSVCIPYFKLFSFVNSFKSWDGEKGVKQVTLKLNKRSLSVKVDNYFMDGKVACGSLRLPLYPTDKVFFPSAFSEPSFILNSDMLKSAISKVIYATDPNASRLFIQGVNMRFEEDKIYIACTDALKLSEYTIDNTSDIVDTSYLVPYNFIMVLRRLLVPETNVFFDVSASKGYVKAVIDNITLHGRLLVGDTFPDYAQSFDLYKEKVLLDREILLLGLVPFISALDDDYKRITIELSEGVLKLYSDTTFFEYNGDLNYTGDFVIDINGQYLIQCLESFSDKQVDLCFSDEHGLFIINSPNLKDHRALITPIRRRG
jgi:DNA polymerase III sliding clamp (beta) subunit (PCNA family)